MAQNWFKKKNEEKEGYVYYCPKCKIIYCYDVNEKGICGNCKGDTVFTGYTRSDWYSKSLEERQNFLDKPSKEELIELGLEEYLDADVKEQISAVKEAEKRREQEEQKKKIKEIEAIKNIELTMLITTGYEFCGYCITKYFGVVSGSTVLGTGFISELSANINDILGMESNIFSDKLEKARNIALKKMRMNAVNIGANAIIGVDFDYVTFSNNMIGVIANGTGVSIREK